MSGISLTTSMRSNLLSLQNISGQVSSTQNKLSTGNKVNSAIDNPSSYYTALSLNNRADDLNALLDSMSQAVSTIKAANEGIEIAQTLIEQMKSIAEQVSSSSQVPDKAFFEEKVGENGAVVSTAQELKDAITAGKETICVYGAIDLGDISTTGGITLAENQKLVGVNYFANFSNGEGFSKISGFTETTNRALITVDKAGAIISDLSFDYKNMSLTGDKLGVIYVNGTKASADLRNLDMTMQNDENGPYRKMAIMARDSTVNLGGKIDVQTSGNRAVGIGAYGDNANITIAADAMVNVNSIGTGGANGLYCAYGNFNIASGDRVNIETVETGIYVEARGVLDIASGALVNVATSGRDANGIATNSNTTVNIAGNVQMSTMNGCGIAPWGTLNILSTANIYINSKNLIKSYGSGQINIEAQAKLAVENNGQKKWYELNAAGSIINGDSVTMDDIDSKLNLTETAAWQTAKEIIEAKNREDGEKDYDLLMTEELSSYRQQYNKVLSQYDKLIADSSYKGVNLIKGESLEVNFNEDRSAGLVVAGEDLSSDKIGIEAVEWQTEKSLQASLDEVRKAQTKLREAAGKLGNYYSIITTRQDFTESLINVLTEGADKLTLADMNEESANMLALQTRQQLAINSLSLASQASQSILKLF